MDKLIEMINTLIHHPDLHLDEGYITPSPEYFEEDTEYTKLRKEVSSKASEVLIKQNGMVNYTAVATLTDKTGWRVTPGETDSFGWLSGVIHTPKGKLVFF